MCKGLCVRSCGGGGGKRFVSIFSDTLSVRMCTATWIFLRTGVRVRLVCCVSSNFCRGIVRRFTRSERSFREDGRCDRGGRLALEESVLFS